MTLLLVLLRSSPSGIPSGGEPYHKKNEGPRLLNIDPYSALYSYVLGTHGSNAGRHGRAAETCIFSILNGRKSLEYYCVCIYIFLGEK